MGQGWSGAPDRGSLGEVHPSVASRPLGVSRAPWFEPKPPLARPTYPSSSIGILIWHSVRQVRRLTGSLVSRSATLCRARARHVGRRQDLQRAQAGVTLGWWR